MVADSFVVKTSTLVYRSSSPEQVNAHAFIATYYSLLVWRKIVRKSTSEFSMLSKYAMPTTRNTSSVVNRKMRAKRRIKEIEFSLINIKSKVRRT